MSFKLNLVVIFTYKRTKSGNRRWRTKYYGRKSILEITNDTRDEL